jgi:hypothetical protein
MQTNQNQPDTQQITPAPTLDNIQLLENFQKKYADKFTSGQLTWWIRQRKHNGLAKSGAVILSARKFYIDENLFTKWFASQKA